ncbi:DUF1176 domain-containing protein [Sphingorhabdus sp. Alg239-R122]|uniref:DUF1176 domain-containing protein n=1 Tax=Sphingorhabdus sp. Alg239-R122 TaxID=2305989 RepID=UPI0013DB32F7|nr:DUF1176 domain-containing protein [Sphingorhabdus sp. Alg239-R122]
MFTTLILAASAAAAPQPGAVKVYRDWYAACDNGAACEAGSMSDGTDTALRVVRLPGRDAMLRISVSILSSGVTDIALVVDGREAARGSLDSEGVFFMGGSDSLKIARMLVRGRTATIMNKGVDAVGDGVLARISLKGSAAAMGYVDARQKRARTRSALSITGRRQDKDWTPKLPLITQQPAARIKKLPKERQLAVLAEKAGCEEQRALGYTKDQVYSLARQDGQDIVVALIACGSGAYNFMSKAYIGERPSGKGRSDWRFRSAPFDYNPGGGFSDDGSPVLVNAFFNVEDGILGNYAKGRGLGDCGSSQSYVWDGTRFRLIEATDMPKCRGVWQWPTIWRAQVKRELKQLARVY